MKSAWPRQSIGDRAQLDAALDYVREGDTLVVTKLDRLARSARGLSELVDALERKGVALRILNFGGGPVDTRGAAGRLMLNVFAAFAQFELEIMKERQREGIADARAPQAEQHALENLPVEVLIYLLGSRYCETDRLSNTAWSLFGNP